FTEHQHEQVRDSLRDLKQFFANGDSTAGVAFELVWRLTGELDAEIGVVSNIGDLGGKELAEVLRQVDAVISTPSTSMLEAMLLGLPVALLDYTNVPHYVPAAWRITAARHIPEVLSELMN